MRKATTLLCFLLFTATLFAQTNGTLKGKLIDTVGKQSLKDASISVLDPKDSTLEVFGLAKEDGSFEVKNISFGTYLVHISFQSYESRFKTITVSKTSPDINLGTIYLKGQSNLLPDVVVTQSPIVMKKDTIEYNAASFKTKPNAVVEDLLKKLPGLEVDKNGGIKAQGETVQRVLVDGKRFFGDDPKMATKNLPPDIVDKIQVFDDLSDQSKFTGFDDGNRVKTLNITTRKDKRKGYFGKAVASIGEGKDVDYDESLSVNRFNGSEQISLTGQANNLNKQNFTSQNILGGRGGSGGGTGSGITKTAAAGLNYRNSWGKTYTTDIAGSYFYNDQSTNTDRNSFTTNSYNGTDSITSNNPTNASISKTANHRFNFNLESKLDSLNSLVFRPNLVFQHSEPNSTSTNITSYGFASTSPKTGLIYNSYGHGSNNSDGINVNGSNLQFRHRFNKRYRTMSLDLNFSASTNNGNGYNYSVTSHQLPYVRTDTIDQHYFDSSKSISFSPTFSYTEPLGKNQILELNYNYSYSNSNSSHNSYSYDRNLKNYNVLDSLFSNSYKFTTISNRFTLNYRMQKDKYNFNIGTGVQYTDRNSQNTTKNINVSDNFINFTPTANFVYNYSRTKNLRIFYNGRPGQPSISQLQPLQTTSDSINFTVGNPDLKPQFTHSLRFLYNSFDIITQRMIFVTINASATTNDIQSTLVNYQNGKRLTSYTNLGGTYNVSGYFNYGFPLKRPKSNMNFTTNLGYNQNQTLSANDTIGKLNIFTHNYTRNTTMGETIRWTTNLKDNFDMNFSAGTTYNILTNSGNPRQNSNYFVHTFSIEATYYTTKTGWILASDFDYTYNGLSSGYSASVPLWNPSIAKQFLKNKAGELRLTCFDLLNQNQSVSRSVGNLSTTDTRTNVLTQYFLLTFTYNLRRFAGTQQRMPSFMGGGRNRGGGEGGGMGGGGFGGGGGGRRG